MLAAFPRVLLAGNCNAGFLNPVTDVSWKCIFPIRIAGLDMTPVTGLGDNNLDVMDKIDSPICTCNDGVIPRVGLSVSFWEPSRVIDTVQDPYCFMALGQQLSNPTPGRLSGTIQNKSGASHLFQQMHFYMFPVWAIMDMFLDVPCIDKTEFDVAMATELIPTWNNDIAALVINPESVLFGNTAAQLACMADSTAALMGKPLNHLFWCMGSWGSAYPLSGNIDVIDSVQANAGLAARGIYFMGRTGLLRDNAVNQCGTTITPIWKKQHYRLQLAKPVRDNSCQVIGRTGLLWSQLKNPPTRGDNFAWMLFKKVRCCVSY